MDFRQHRRHESVEMNLTPLIDVVFLLLIFFMVSTSFTRETQIAVELPEANGKPLKTEMVTIEVSINSAGEYFVNAEALVNRNIETLERAIAQLAGPDRTLPVVISGDANAPYQSVATAMDVIGQLGFVQITLATRQPSEVVEAVNE